jgi:hypothetical protein
LIFAESAVGFVHSEKMAVGIVLRVQPNSHFESCAKDMVLYAKRKGANLLPISARLTCRGLPGAIFFSASVGCASA